MASEAALGAGARITPTRVLYHEPDRAMSLGCIACPEREICGGLQTSAPAFDCLAHCDCADKATCEFVCAADPVRLAWRSLEVGGFDLTSIPAAPASAPVVLPDYVPVLYHRSKRVRPLVCPAVAIPLARLFSRKTGAPMVAGPAEAAGRFAYDRAALVLVDGVAADAPLETYWGKARAEGAVAALRALKPALVTVPNFSVFVDVPRWDNLHAMKRIAIGWHEFAAAGVPAALHLNARTDRDWDRWAEFLIAHEEIDTVAFEFATGGARRQRAEWYVEKLSMVAAAVPHGLRLVARGGLPYVARLRPCFEQVVYLDTSAFVRTCKRKLAFERPDGRLGWDGAMTLLGQPLDDLLARNVSAMGRFVTDRLTAPKPF